MRWWGLRAYVAFDGRDRVQEWYELVDEIVQTEFETVFQLLALDEDWFSDGPAKSLRDYEADGLCEIVIEVHRHEVTKNGKLKMRKEHHRLVGFIASYPQVVQGKVATPGTFVQLVAEKKTGGRYRVARAYEDAARLKHELEAGKGTLHDVDL